MRLSIATLSAVGLLLVSSLSRAEMLDGDTLLKWCAAQPNTIEKATCTFYIKGFMDGIGLGNSAAVCFPPNLTIGEAISAFVRISRGYLRDPGVAKADFRFAALAAFAAAFPCQRSN